jgi:hypothetical protein
MPGCEFDETKSFKGCASEAIPVLHLLGELLKQHLVEKIYYTFLEGLAIYFGWPFVSCDCNFSVST